MLHRMKSPRLTDYLLRTSSSFHFATNGVIIFVSVKLDSTLSGFFYNMYAQPPNMRYEIPVSFKI